MGYVNSNLINQIKAPKEWGLKSPLGGLRVFPNIGGFERWIVHPLLLPHGHLLWLNRSWSRKLQGWGFRWGLLGVFMLLIVPFGIAAIVPCIIILIINPSFIALLLIKHTPFFIVDNAPFKCPFQSILKGVYGIHLIRDKCHAHFPIAVYTPPSHEL